MMIVKGPGSLGGEPNVGMIRPKSWRGRERGWSDHEGRLIRTRDTVSFRRDCVVEGAMNSGACGSLGRAELSPVRRPKLRRQSKSSKSLHRAENNCYSCFGTLQCLSQSVRRE